MALTSDELTDFREDIGDANGVFSDAAIQRLYTRAGSYAGAILMAIDQLLASATKLHDYKQNMSEEKQSQVFNHLMDLRALKAAELKASTTQMRIVGMRAVPPARQEKPNAYDGLSTGNNWPYGEPE